MNVPTRTQGPINSAPTRVARRLDIRRIALAGCLIAVLCLPLFSLNGASASGTFWLPTKLASDASFDHLNPVLATYKNHAYVLSVRPNDSSGTTSVFFSTNETGTWTTQLMSNEGPIDSFSRAFTSLAVDASTGRLYATWVYHKNADADALGVWTRDPAGQWSGPTEAVTAGSLVGQPFIAAGNGRAYATFISSETLGACDSVDRNADVLVVGYDGNSWSAPQNLTSCVSNTDILEFNTPKLALDEQGRAYVVSELNGDLWYTDNASGSWSDPTQITHGANIPGSVGTALRTFYGIAFSNGTAYVTFARHGDTPTDDVFLMSRAEGGSWSAPTRVSPNDPQDCPKFGLSIVANAGRVGVSYVRGSQGYCHASGGTSGNVPYVFTGSPGQLVSVSSLEGKTPDCFATSLSNEGSLFQFVAACDQPSTLSKGQLYYKAEFLDTVGPIARLQTPTRATSHIQLHWSASDPRPGSGVASYQLRVRVDGGAWKTLLESTSARTFTYHQKQGGHHYTFRVRAKDRVDNWGGWASVSVSVR